MKKRTLAVLLTMLLVISMVPMAAMAEGTCECGYEYMYANYNGNGTHTWICSSCGLPVSPDETPNGSTTESCTAGADGDCTECGYGVTVGHDHWDESVKCEPNGDGTHTWYCGHDDCGKDLGTYSCEYNNEDICDYCLGAKPENPVTGLDNVPKTGDNGSLIAVTSLTVLAMFAAAFYITDKKRAF